MYSGYGGQRVGMGRELYEREDAFRETFDRCRAIARPLLGVDLGSVVFPTAEPEALRAADSELQKMAVGQAALLSFEIALTRVWERWGVVPEAVVGHSLGAYAAAHVAGVLALGDALELAIRRGHLLDSLPPGLMLAVPMREDEIVAALDMDDGEVSIAAVNGPSQCVLSGGAEAIARFESEFLERGVPVRRLRIAAAAHSKMVEPILPLFAEHVRSVSVQPPAIPWISDTSGQWVSAELVQSPAFWPTHLRHTVRFGDALATALADGKRVLLEIGPSRTLTALARQHPAVGNGERIVASMAHPEERVSQRAAQLAAAGRLWELGTRIEWRRLHEDQPRRVPLPTYPFQRQRFALEHTPHPAGGGERQDRPVEVLATRPAARRNDATAREGLPASGAAEGVAALFAEVLGMASVGADESFFDLGGDSVIAARLVTRVRAAFQVGPSVREVFENPTVRQLTSLIQQMLDCAAPPPEGSP